MRSIECISPAKLNLFLEIKFQRDDGYHEIETVMQTVSICDTLTLFEIDDGIKIEADADWLPLGRDNLAYAAAEQFFKNCSSVHKGIKITIQKNIPAGKGLAGGSSNAASVLKGLNTLYGEMFSLEELAKMASGIGADVCFFLYGGTAVCRGKGEIVEVLDIPHTFHYIIIIPPLHISTPVVYQYLREKGEYPEEPEMPDRLIQALQAGDHTMLECGFFNRLENAALGCSDELNEIRKGIIEIGGLNYRLTGSGAAYFKLVKNKEEGLEEEQRLASLRTKYNCDIVYCEGNLRGTKDGNYRSEDY